MKFRILVIVFNAVIFVSFLMIFLLPALVLGWDYAGAFWGNNWLVAVVFLVVLGGLNSYFGYNWKVFTLLEAENWNGLVAYLEDQLFKQNRGGRHRIRIMINAYVLSGQIGRILELKTHLESNRPDLVPRFAVELGIPLLQGQDGPGMIEFYGAMKANPKCAEPMWVRWNYAFALMLEGRREEAEANLKAVLAESKEPLQLLLSAYTLSEWSGGNGDTETERVREQLRKEFSAEKWGRYIDRRRDGLQILILRSAGLVDNAARWAGFGNEDEKH